MSDSIAKIYLEHAIRWVQKQSTTTLTRAEVLELMGVTPRRTPRDELLRDALEALEPFAAQTRASGPTEERNIRRARTTADKIRAALTE